jgi:methionyl-tRNA formyltransferase
MQFGTINKYILFGGGDLLLKVALFLKEKNHEVCIVTSERHFNENLLLVDDNNFGEFLINNSLKHIISKNISNDTSVKNLISEDALGLSFGAAWVFKENFINLFNGKLLNLHGSRLPQNRGGGGFSWRIMVGDKVGVSLIHQIFPGIDTGDIIGYENYLFSEKCRIPIDYSKESIFKYFDFMCLFFQRVESHEEFMCTGQPEYLSTYWPRLNTDIHGYINWSFNVKDIERFVCAFDDPYKGAITIYNDEEIRLKKVFSNNNDGSFHPFQSGIIYRKINKMIFVAVNNGSLIINEVLNNNGDNIISTMTVGDRFYTPQAKLEKALQYRATYTPRGLKEG